MSSLLLMSCAGEPTSAGPEATISSQSFVEVMVQLRTSALLESSGYLPPGEPERILAENGLTADQLRQFVATHGENVPLMADVWEEIERRVSEGEGANDVIEP